MGPQRLGASEGEAEIPCIFHPFDQQQERRRAERVDQVDQLLGGHARLSADQRHHAAVRLAVRHRVELAAIDRFHRHVQLAGQVQQLLQFFDVSAVAHQDDLEHPLAGAQGGEDGLSAFEMFHSLKAAESKPKPAGFR